VFLRDLGGSAFLASANGQLHSRSCPQTTDNEQLTTKRSMKRRLASLPLLLLLLSTCGLAQQTKSANPVTDTVRNLLQRESKNLTAAANEMPAEKYNFKPTPQQMSFGKLVAHIAESNNFLCAKLADQARPMDKVSENDAKEKLVAALKSSFDSCQSALAQVQDAQLDQPVTMWGGRQAPKAAALIGLTNDWADHYGAAAIYLRLNGLLPPTAQVQAKK
jgi:uncharacterized damage-inducible protein DinB